MTHGDRRDRLREAYFGAAPHEEALLGWLPRLLSGARTFVDVGASLGQYTQRAAGLLPDGEVLAIEADPWRHGELAREAAAWASASGSRIRTLHAAACEVPGSITFLSTGSDLSGGLFTRPAAGVEWSPVTVPAVTLDDVAPAGPGLVKIDVEGVELRVLQGAARLLREGRYLWLIEIHGWGDPERGVGRMAVLAHMLRRGYLPAFLHGSWLFARPGLLWLQALAAGLPGLLARALRRAGGSHRHG